MYSITKYKLNELDLYTFKMNKIDHATRKKVIKMSTKKLEAWNKRFVQFICSTIRYATITFLRSHRRYVQKNVTLMDTDVAAVEPDFFTSHSDLTNAAAELSFKQQVIVYQKYTAGYSDIEIADQLCLSPQAIGKLRRQALMKMRTYLTEHAQQEVIPHQTL